MFKDIWRKIFKPKKKDLKQVIRQEIEENKEILKSLRDYDAGKKDISTTELERRLPNIRVTS